MTPADEEFHINKSDFKAPFVCGARNLGEALRRIGEGAAMIRTKGEAGTGNVVEAVRHMRAMNLEIAAFGKMNQRELKMWAKRERVNIELVEETKALVRLPVVNFAAGGIATPADAALMMQLGCDGIFVGSGIFKSANPESRARAIVEATMYYKNPEVLERISRGLGKAMDGLEIAGLEQKMAERGW